MKKTRSIHVLLTLLFMLASLSVYPVNITVKFLTSDGENGIANGQVKYFKNGWKNFGTTDANGEASKNLPDGTYSFQMKYEGKTVTRENVYILIENPVVFQTLKMVVKLTTEGGEGIGGGEVEYKSPGWSYFGTTNSGGGSGGGGGGCGGGGSSGGGCGGGEEGHEPGCPGGSGGGTHKELLPGTYSFRMTYEGKTITMNNVDIMDEDDIPLVFQTVKMVVKLKDSEGGGLEGGIVEFNSSGWKEFGLTQNPGGGSSGGGGCGGEEGGEEGGCGGDEEGHEPGCSGGSGNSGGNGGGGGCGGEEGGCGGSGGNGGGNGGPGGNVHKELLPGSYTFRMTWQGASQTVANVNIEEESPLLFHTVKTIVKLMDSDGIGLPGGVVTFHSTEWRDGGTTDESGEAILELLARGYEFNMEYAGTTFEKSLNVSDPEAYVEFEWDGTSLKSSESINLEESITANIYPNPSSDYVSLRYILMQDCKLNITIFDMNGKSVNELFNGNTIKGEHTLIWNGERSDGNRLESGRYLCRILADEETIVKQIILVK